MPYSAPSRASWKIVRGALLILAGALACSCARKAEPLVPPERQVASADLERLARQHPAWGELESTVSRLRELGVEPPEAESEVALQPLRADEFGPGDPPTWHPDARSAEAATRVTEGDDPRDIVDRNQRPGPDWRDPPAEREGGAERPSAESAPTRLRSEAEAAGREIADARRNTLEIRGPGAEDPDRWSRSVDAEAESAAARLRSGWTPESAPAAEQAAAAGEMPATGDATVDYEARANARARELEREVSREAERAGEFFEAEDPPRTSGMPDRPAAPEPRSAGAGLGGDIGQEARALAERYLALRERILTDTRRSATAVGASLGLDVNFERRGPDCTEQLATALRAFYHRDAVTMGRTDTDETG